MNLRRPSTVFPSMRCAVLTLPLLLLGCASEPPPEVIELEADVARLEHRIDGLAGLERRIEALEALAAKPKPGGNAALRQQLVLLEAEVVRLRERLKALEAGRRPPKRTDKPITTVKGPRVLTIPTPKSAAKSKPPRAGTDVEVLTVGAGGLVLIRAGKRLERVRLLGIEPPARKERYDRDPALRTRHAALFSDVSGEAWKRSREHLATLVKDARITVAYSTGAKRDASGSLRAYLQRVRGRVVEDLNERMISDGYAVPSGEDHLRLEAYKLLGKRARRAGAGLVKKGGGE